MTYEAIAYSLEEESTPSVETEMANVIDLPCLGILYCPLFLLQRMKSHSSETLV